jgi:hypothetical protein
MLAPLAMIMLMLVLYVPFLLFDDWRSLRRLWLAIEQIADAFT